MMQKPFQLMSPWEINNTAMTGSPLERAGAVAYGRGPQLPQNDFQIGAGAADEASGGGEDVSFDPSDSPMGFDPSFLDMARAAGNEAPTDQDKGMALAEAGFGAAASGSPTFLGAIGAGGMQGLKALQQLQQQRALQQLKAATLQNAVNNQQALQQYRQQQIVNAKAAAADRDATRAETIRHNKADEANVGAAKYEMRFDPYGNAVVFDKSNGKIIDDPAGSGSGSGDTDADKRIDSAADMIGNYDMAPLSGYAMRSPYGQSVMAKVREKFPEYSATDWGARSQLKKEFASTKSGAGANIQSANTLVGHLNSLREAAHDLDNSAITKYNSIANYAAQNTGDPRINRFLTARNAVAEEATRLFRNTGGSLAEVQGWENVFDKSASIPQIDAATAEMVKLMESRTDSLASTWNRTMGIEDMPDNKKYKTGLTLLNQKSRDVIGKIVPKTAPSPTAVGSSDLQKALDLYK